MRIYNSLSNPDSKSGSNKVISPYSLLSVLTLAMLGTKGITKNQIRDALYLPCDDEANYYEAYSNTMNSLFNYQEHFEKESGRHFTLEAANRIYFDKSINLVDTYVQKSSKQLNAKPAKAPFSEDPELARTKINTWVKMKTRSKIKNMLPQNTIDTNTKVVLVNAMYLNVSWSIPFTSSSMKRFYNQVVNFTSGSELSYPYKIVEMMTAVGNFVTAYLPQPFNAKLLSLPYQSGAINSSMIIILPNNSSGFINLDETEKTITGMAKGEITKIFAKLHEQQKGSNIMTLVEMPKFKIETEVNLKPTLVELGVKSLFDPMNCNLSAMIKGDNSGLSVDSILQKTYISTDLKGTEAAASTSTISKTSFSSQAQNRFIIDRPFMFIIRANDINLFLGKVLIL